MSIKIILEIQSCNKIELTMEEAKSLYGELRGIFENKQAVPVYREQEQQGVDLKLGHPNFVLPQMAK